MPHELYPGSVLIAHIPAMDRQHYRVAYAVSWSMTHCQWVCGIRTHTYCQSRGYIPNQYALRVPDAITWGDHYTQLHLTWVCHCGCFLLLFQYHLVLHIGVGAAWSYLCCQSCNHPSSSTVHPQTPPNSPPISTRL